jgi:hypothetical protein
MAEIDLENSKSSISFANYSGLILFVGFLFLLILLLRNVALFEPWAFGDLGLPPSDLRSLYERTFYIWQSEGIGSVGSPMVNVKIMMLVLSLLTGTVLVSKVLLLSTFVISYGSCYYLLRKLGIRPLICFTGAVLYAFNPVSVAGFIGGEISEVMTFAIFPVLIWLVFKVFNDDKHPAKSLSMLALLLFFFVWNIYVAFWYVVLVVVPLLLVLLITKKGDSVVSKKDILARLCIICLIVAGVFAPSLVLIQAKTSAASETSFIPDSQYTYRSMSIDNVLRMAGNTGSAQENLGYNTYSLFTVFGSVIVFVAIAPMLLFGNKHLSTGTKLFLISCSASFALAVGLALLVRSYPGIVDYNLLFASLRNPKKLLFPLVFALTVLLTINTGRILSSTKRGLIRGSVICGLLLCILFYNIPAMDGTLGLEKVRGRSYIVDQKYDAIPLLLEDIDPQYKNYRVFVFPWQFATNTAIHPSLLNYFGTPLGAGADGVNVGEFGKMFKLIGESSAARQSIFTTYNVKYIVIDKTFDRYPGFLEGQLGAGTYEVYYDHDSYWVTGDPSYLNAILSDDSSFVRSYEDSQFAIFTFTGLLSPTTLSIADTDITASSSFENDGLENWHVWPANLVRVDTTDGFDGERSLAMQGLTDWWSNAHKLVPIEDRGIYQLQFAVKPFNKTDLHVKLLWYDQNDAIRDDTALRTDYIKLYEMPLVSSEWNTVERTFSPPAGAKFVDIQLLGSRIRNPDLSTLTLYDDISLSQITLTDSSDLTFGSTNPAHWWMKMSSNEPTKVVFSQSYDPRWEVRVYKDGVLVEVVKPARFVNVENSFDITTVGSDLYVEFVFTPQSMFEASFIFVAAAVVPASGYLLYSSFRYVIRHFYNFSGMFHRGPSRSSATRRIGRLYGQRSGQYRDQ